MNGTKIRIIGLAQTLATLIQANHFKLCKAICVLSMIICFFYSTTKIFVTPRNIGEWFDNSYQLIRDC